MELNAQVFDKTFDNVVKALPLRKSTETIVITAKNILTNDVVQNKIKNVFDNIFDKNRSVSDVQDVKNIIEEKGFIGSISDTVTNAINTLKDVDKNIADKLSDCKDIIIDKLISDETKNRFEGQEKILQKIDEKYNKWEKAFKDGDVKSMDKIYTQIEKQYQKLLPTVKAIEKVNELKNINELVKYKIENKDYTLTEMERELCRKVG
ncbi:MAG: hypothetical protein E7311_03915 [Clostridiales bacterium]|nr:hypothetical protein [Clostridiales bacterium]